MTNLPDPTHSARIAMAATSGRPVRWWSPRSRPPLSDPWLEKRSLEHFFLFGPLVGWTLIALAYVVMSVGSMSVGDVLTGLYGVVWPWIVVAPATVYRVRQEVERCQERRWFLDRDLDRWILIDPSGEWEYTRRPPKTGRRLRRLVAFLMVAVWLYALSRDSYGSGALWWLALPFVTAAIIYVHRHLPTPYVPAESYLDCRTCGARSDPTYRICTRCRRIAELVQHPCQPSLRRRLRDL